MPCRRERSLKASKASRGLARRMPAVLVGLALIVLVPSVWAAGTAGPAVLSISIAPGALAVTGTPGAGAVTVVARASREVRQPDAVLVLLGAGVKPAELLAFIAADRASDANAVSRYGKIVFDAPVKPDSGTEIQTSLAAGTYLAFDAEGEKSARWPHTEFTVTSAAAPAPLGPPEAVEKTVDFAFKGPRTLHREEVVRFENEGFLAQMDLALPARGHMRAERLRRDLLAGRERAAEKLISGPPVTFAGPLSTGALEQQILTAPAGWYVQVSPLRTQDGRTEAELGMERTIRIN